jgi:hypothetical protein
LIFQTLDDKQECVGVYADGKLHFDNMPSDLLQTWKYTGSITDKNVEYAWIYCDGQTMSDVCPEELKQDWESALKKLNAYKKAFTIAKLNLREHCFFDLIPHDALVEFCEVKNKITKHVFDNYEKPANYEYLAAASKLLHKIKHQDLMVDNKDCRQLFVSSTLLAGSRKILAGNFYIDYNLFGTRTGRLTTHSLSFPVLTMKRELRALVKPRNSWFLSLDYNGAEVRTLLALSEQKQPTEDIHEWNIKHVFEDANMTREQAKTVFFSWLYNPEADHVETNYYDREKVLDRYYDGEYINTIFGRRIKVEPRKAFNYLIQSTTADLVIERAIAIDEFLNDTKSFISHIVHDEIVIDFADEDRELIPQVREIFSSNRLANFMVNLKAGKDYFYLKKLSL